MGQKCIKILFASLLAAAISGISVFAGNSEGIDDVQALEQALERRQKVVLSGDIDNITQQIVLPDNATLDLNGCTLSGSVGGGLIVVDSGAEATITDSSAGAKGSIVNAGLPTSRAVLAAPGSRLTLDGGISLSSESSSNAGGACALYINATPALPSSVTIKDAKLTSASDYAVYGETASTLHVEGGYFYAPSRAYTIESGGEVSYSGGTFGSWSPAIDAQRASAGCCFAVDAGGAVTVAESPPRNYSARIGSFYLSGGSNLYELLIYSGAHSGTLEIMDDLTCSFPDGEAFGGATGISSRLNIDMAPGKTLSGSMPLQLASISVSGGTVPENFFRPSDGKYQLSVSPSEDGMTITSRFADGRLAATVSFGEDLYYYTNLVGALNEAKKLPGCVLQLNGDVRSALSVASGAAALNMTLDLNGHTYTYTGNGDAFSLSSANCFLTVADNSEAGGGTVAVSDSAASAVSINGAGSRFVLGAGAAIEGNSVLVSGHGTALDIYGSIDGGVLPAVVLSEGASGGKIDIRGGASVAGGGSAIYHCGSGELTVYEGAAVSGGGIGIEMRSGTLNVLGGSVSGGSGQSGAGISAPAQPAEVNIYSGTISGGTAIYAGETPENADISIHGGHFSTRPREEFCAEGCAVSPDGNGGYEVLSGDSTSYPAQILGAGGQAISRHDDIGDAISAALPGQTIRLLGDISATGQETLKLYLPAGVTLDGGGYTISGNVSIYINAAGGAITGAGFKDIHNSSNNLSAIYAPGLYGSLNITGCTFENVDWDSVQATPLAGSAITISGNVFSDPDAAVHQQRFIHIEAGSQNCSASVTLTDNVMFTSNLDNAAIGVYYLAPDGELSFSGNYMDDTSHASIVLGEAASAINLSGLIFPARSQPYADTDDLRPEAGIDLNGWSMKFYSTLEDALEAAEDGQSVVDLSVPYGLGEASVTLDTVCSESIVYEHLQSGGRIILPDLDRSGYKLVGWDDGETLYEPGQAFYVSGSSALKAEWVPAVLPFLDVSEESWYFDCVDFVYSNGMMEGTSAETFEPNANMTRSMVWAILARIDGEDITGTSWQKDARVWAVLSGVSDGTDANGLITREQLVTMLWRYAGEPAPLYALTGYTDAGGVSSWAQSAMAWAIGGGIINGISDSVLAPQGHATRAQAAAILMRSAAVL